MEKMADSASSSSSNAVDLRAHLIKEVKGREVAVAEHNCLSPSRPVYQKNADIYFHTTIQKATASVQMSFIDTSSYSMDTNSVPNNVGVNLTKLEENSATDESKKNDGKHKRSDKK